jgi:hypothetical protein
VRRQYGDHSQLRLSLRAEHAQDDAARCPCDRGSCAAKDVTGHGEGDGEGETDGDHYPDQPKVFQLVNPTRHTLSSDYLYVLSMLKTTPLGEYPTRCAS